MAVGGKTVADFHEILVGRVLLWDPKHFYIYSMTLEKVFLSICSLYFSIKY